MVASVCGDHVKRTRVTHGGSFSLGRHSCAELRDRSFLLKPSKVSHSYAFKSRFNRIIDQLYDRIDHIYAPLTHGFVILKTLC